MDDELLREISRLYYEQGCTQQEISKKVFVSRAAVSRALEEARQRGIVEIIIHYPYENHTDLEQQLIRRFSLRSAIVNNDANMLTSESYMAVCQMAAREMNRQLNNSTVMSISRGRTTKNIIQAFVPSRTLPDMELVQLCGAHEEDDPAMFEESDHIRMLQNKLNCKSWCMFVPGLLESKELRNMLVSRKSASITLSKAKDVNYLCLSVTTLEQWKRWLTPSQIASLRRKGAVGNLLGYFFDENGQILDSKLYERWIIADRCVFQAEQRVLVVADSFKAQAACAALNGKLANSIITTGKVARKILALHQNP